jgi:hypothetical protein
MFSQNGISIDSTAITLTVKPTKSDNGFCTPNTESQKFIVIESSGNRFITSIFVKKENLRGIMIDSLKTYTIKGNIVYQEDWIYGCWSSRWKESRVYILPISTEPLIQIKNSKFINLQ